MFQLPFNLPTFLLENSTRDYLWALGVFGATIALFGLVKAILIKKLRKWTDQTTTKMDDAIIKGVKDIGPVFYFLLGVQVAFQFLKFPALVEQTIYYATLIAAVYYLTKGFSYLVEQGIKSLARSKDRDQEASIVEILIRISKGILWVIAFLLVLSNLGYNISSLLTGVGISGVAIAFALRNILEDLFSAFSIYFDKPFEPGDFIEVGKDSGVVQSIGLKSTRLKTLQGEQLVISNKELTKARVNNYKKMERRRTKFQFGVVYGTPTEKLNKIPGMVKDIINQIELAEADRVHFTEFEDSSLKFEAFYFIDSSEMETYKDIQQQINLTLHEKFNEENIEMAFPTRTIHLEQ